MPSPHYALKLLLARSEQEAIVLSRQLLWTTDDAERSKLKDKLAELQVTQANLKADLPEEDQRN